MLRRFLSAVTSLKNRWRVLCPVPIPIIYFVFLCFASRIWKLSFLAKRVFISRVNNLRHVAILFDALLENSFIQFRWQSVLDRGKFLQSKDGSRFVSASSLSSALSAVRGNMTSVAYIIRQTIGQLKE